MTKSDWMSIAEALHLARAGVALPGELGIDAHDRKLIHFATLETIDRVALLLAATIKARSPRFDEQRFLRLVGVRLPQR